MSLLSKLAYKLAGLPELHKDFRHQRGQERYFDHFSHSKDFGVVFEDDGDTGYFYALEVLEEKQGFQIVEAMHIYDSADSEFQRRCSICVAFSSDGLRAILTLDSHPVALFDFVAKKGYCRNNFPKPMNWGDSFDWNDSVFEAFEDTEPAEQGVPAKSDRSGG